MQKNEMPQTSHYTTRNRHRRVWKKVVGALACVVVFITTYALILPAITMEREPVCGLEEHTHTEECYKTELIYSLSVMDCPFEAHTHGADCYDDGGDLICGYADFTVHTHDALCYDESGALICTLPEIEEHVHTGDCYNEERTLICTEEEDPGHIHTAACYKQVRGDLICTEEGEDHEHGDSCYAWTEELICREEEREPGHIHDDSCYETRQVLACGEEEVILHTHGDSCFDEEGVLICGQIEVLEHRHTQDCIQTPESGPEEVRVLICTLEEHTHTEECFPEQEPEPQEPGLEVPETEEPIPEGPETGASGDEAWLCGLTEHTHGEDCYSPEGELICSLEEHTHTEECLPEAPQEDGATELSYSGSDYTVRVSYGPDAALPEGASLLVREIPSDTEEYQAYYAQAAAALEEEQTPTPETLVFARFFDVQFQYEGRILEPAAPVSVTITYDTPVDTSEAASCKAIHFGEDGTELLDVQTEIQDAGETSFTHTQDSFSVVGNLVTVNFSAANSTDVGPDSLPVDYYVCIDGAWTCVGSTKTGWYGDYTATGWTDYNRDYITVAQAESILGAYGFRSSTDNPARQIAYQIKSDTKIYSDTNTVEIGGQKVIPLSRNGAHPGFNVYYLPANTGTFSGKTQDGLDKTANGFYTVKVYDTQGELLTSEVVETGGSFTYDASESGVASWLVVYGSGNAGTVTGNTITLNSITSTVMISPQGDETAGSHSVTFKVMIDGQWQTVGTLPYYYTGNFNGSSRAYITSAMAAQFFGDFGYTAATDPGYHFGYSYNDIYTIRYSTNTNYCIDITGGKIVNETSIQLYKSNSSNAQIFRIWDAGNGYSFITPVTDSGLHINIPSANMTDGQQLWIHTATDAASQWKVIYETNGTVSFQAAKDASFYLDLDSGTTANSAKLQIWTNGSNRYWKLDQQYRISNNTVSAQNSDGTYNIGLTAESNGDIVCYYLPAETGNTYTNAAESAISTDNSFWSVTVRDDAHAVYSDGELSGMVQYAANGGEATVTVQNANGILWSCRGVNGEPVEVESTQSGGYTTFTIKNITQPVEVVATRANPTFTVQYYANIPRFATSGSNALTVIDTSADANSGKATLPTNGGSMATKSLYLEGTGQNTSQNAGNATQLYRVKMTTELTKLYSDGQYQYESSPGLNYFNKLKDNTDYNLTEIWILKAGKDPGSTNRDDWDIYTYASDMAFTNEAGQAVGNTLLITDGMVIRLVSDTSSGSYYNGTTFYDYNISSGQNSDGRWRTGITGINSESNYGTSLNGQRTWRSGADIFAFGNANCGTGMSGYLFDGSTLNKYSSKNSGYGGTTFGLASSLNSDGTIRYSDWIVAPKLFNDGDATGKQTYAGSSLTFDRVGDTYTLSAATLNNSNGQSNTLSGLQYFFNPSPTSGTTHTHIFTNNFWPMDPAAGRTDALWGKYDNPGSFQGFTETNDYNWSSLAKNFPVSDDGQAHNWFFGMNFAISFNLTADYEGPLEYYFFGDDDMWVFLDNQLVCDIGGVHSSVGEYVNLRDYLPVGSSGQHTLTFFYTERGASGSTCYMSFTLPSVSSATTARDTGSLQIKKSLAGTGDADYSGEEYQFRVELLTSENGSPLNQTFSYSRSDGTYGTIKSGGTVSLKKDESITISGIPAGTFYRVTELTTEGYTVTVNGNEGYIVSGKIETGAVKPASFVNTPVGYELPSTGGGGTFWYTLGGLCLMAGALLLYRKRLHRRGGRDSPC
ncbi:MAG: fibro-slime domain-containing protein [Oscillospiraceae bacterium]